MNLSSTISNKDWLLENEKSLKDLFPDIWTHISKLNALQVGYGLKLLGVDWRNEDDFGIVMVSLVRAGILLRDGYTIRRKM